MDKNLTPAAPPPAALVDLGALGWDDARIAAALAVALANNERIARAAAARLTLHDQAADFAAWCDGTTR